MSKLIPSAPGRVLVMGQLRMTVEGGSDIGYGDCRLGSTASGGIPGTTVDHATQGADWVSITGVTDVYQAGNYRFGIDCRETLGEMQIDQARITAVVISPF